MGKGEVEAQGIRGIDGAEGLGDLHRHSAVRGRTGAEAYEPGSSGNMCIQRDYEGLFAITAPLAEIGPPVPH